MLIRLVKKPQPLIFGTCTHPLTYLFQPITLQKSARWFHLTARALFEVGPAGLCVLHVRPPPQSLSFCLTNRSRLPHPTPRPFHPRSAVFQVT